jgi:DNA-binding XRE family transcriptional regulator
MCELALIVPRHKYTVFNSVRKPYKTLMAKDTEAEKKFFAALGLRIQAARKRAGYSQEDMISFGYGVRHWQRIEAGKPITLRTLLRICRILGTTMEAVVRGLGPAAMKRPVKRP